MRNVNQCFCRKVRQSVPWGSLICAALAVLILPLRTYAQFTGSASATGQFESNSNVFALNNAGYEQPGTNDLRRSDTYYSYGAGFEGDYIFGGQQLYATASTKEYDYQHLTELNHNDYKVDAGLIWKLGDLLDGKVDATRTHLMVPFYDLTGTEQALSLVTDQRETVQIGFKLSSDWKLSGSAFTSSTNQPVFGSPDLQLKQTSGSTSLQYLGISGLTSGFTAGYLSGDYTGSNVALNPSYTQITAGFLANYKHYRSVFEGQIGYTKRSSDTGTDDTKGFTGAFNLTQQLTPKTSITAKVDRAINAYLLNASSEIDSDAGLAINWQATYKVAGSLGYTFSYRDFPKQGNNPVGSTRVDIQEYWTMGVNYQPRRWLMVRPYANLMARRTTFVGGAFSQTVVGVAVTFMTPNSTIKPR